MKKKAVRRISKKLFDIPQHDISRNEPVAVDLINSIYEESINNNTNGEERKETKNVE